MALALLFDASLTGDLSDHGQAVT